MLRALATAMTIFVFLASHVALADTPPSSGAADMAGAKGTFSFKPSDWKGTGHKSWWKDSDGVGPGVAGCHVGTDETGKANGRTFGEACLANGLLVESNPGKDVLHSHKDDIGHPDTFDCNKWCKASGKTAGVCQVVTGPAPCASSAICKCQ